MQFLGSILKHLSDAPISEQFRAPKHPPLIQFEEYSFNPQTGAIKRETNILIQVISIIYPLVYDRR